MKSPLSSPLLVPRKPDGDVIAEELGLDHETAKRLGVA